MHYSLSNEKAIPIESLFSFKQVASFIGKFSHSTHLFFFHFYYNLNYMVFLFFVYLPTKRILNEKKYG